MSDIPRIEKNGREYIDLEYHKKQVKYFRDKWLEATDNQKSNEVEANASSQRELAQGSLDRVRQIDRLLIISYEGVKTN